MWHQSGVDVISFLIFILTGVLIWILMRRPKGIPHGPVRIPILGSTALFTGAHPADAIAGLRQQYGDIFSIYVGNKLLIFFNGYEVFKEAFVKNAAVFSTKASTLITDKLAQGKGIVSTNGVTWKEQRKFALGALKELGLRKTNLEFRIQTELKKFIEAVNQMLNVPFDIHDITQTAVANVICSITFGQRFDYNDPDFRQYVQGIDENMQDVGVSTVVNFFPILEHLPGDPFKIKKVFKNIKKMEKFIETVVQHHLDNFDSSKINDFTDAYIKEMALQKENNPNTSFSVEQLRTVLGDMLVAGMETTTSSLLWCLVYLLNYPHFQVILQKEIDSHIGRNRLPSLEDRTHLPFLEAYIMEVQRHANVVQLLLGRKPEHSITFRGYNIPEDSIVIPNLGSIMNDVTYWGDPHNFRPTRFLENSNKVIKPETFIPFFIGKRSCFGEPLAKAELFIFLAGILQQFTLECPSGGKPPSMKGNFGVTNVPERFDIKIVQRSQAATQTTSKENSESQECSSNKTTIDSSNLRN
ncbi:cytochrome P450 2U1-like [Argonauta hians]